MVKTTLEAEQDGVGLTQVLLVELVEMDSVPLTVSYASPLHLMREVRMMGEGNAIHARLRHPTRKAVFDRACEIYADTFGDGAVRVNATFELIVMTGWAPDDSQPKPLRPGSASARLADALGTSETSLKD